MPVFTHDVSELQMIRLLDRYGLTVGVCNNRWIWHIEGSTKLVLSVTQDGVTFSRDATPQPDADPARYWVSASPTHPVWVALGAIDEQLLTTTLIPAADGDIARYAAWIRDQAHRHGFPLGDLFQVQYRLICRLLSPPHTRHHSALLPAMQVYPCVLAAAGVLKR